MLQKGTLHERALLFTFCNRLHFSEFFIGHPPYSEFNIVNNNAI